MQPSTSRADALDALRGLAVLMMILSGAIHFIAPLPAWMYHAQVAPPDFKFNPNLPGITWVDLVFPFFLFAMGAAFPFALSKKLDQGVPKWKVLLQIVQRGILLAWFAIFIQHVKPFALHAEPLAVDWLIGLLGFVLLFAMLMRFPGSVPPPVRAGIRAAGFAAAAVLLAALQYPDGSGFSVGRSDIIILVLANVAVFGAALWVFTRDSLLLRLGVLGFLMALRLTQSIDGSWNHWLWTLTPFPWLYKLYYLQYLFIVIPGTIAGDILYRHMSSPRSEPDGLSRLRMAALAAVLAAMVTVTVAGLYARLQTVVLVFDVALCAAGWLLLSREQTGNCRLYRTLLGWGIYWLMLGLAFEAFEGGIKKDHPTVSYYCVTTGLAIASLILLSIFIDGFRWTRALRMPILTGRNPMIAYIGASNVVLPVLALTHADTVWTLLPVEPWVGLLKGIAITLCVALTASVCTARGWFWRT